MKLLVLSDTHGRIEEAERVFRSLEGIDQILHLGDYAKDGVKLGNILKVPVITVKGNMDGSFSTDDYKIINTEYGKIYITHGHMESVKYSTESLLYKASSLGCKAAVFGHTHVPLYEEKGGMYLINPGSLTLPRGGRPGSYGIVNTEHDRFEATILYFDSIKKEADKTGEPKSCGPGFLRRVFNDSDGQ